MLRSNRRPERCRAAPIGRAGPRSDRSAAAARATATPSRSRTRRTVAPRHQRAHAPVPAGRDFPNRVERTPRLRDRGPEIRADGSHAPGVEIMADWKGAGGRLPELARNPLDFLRPRTVRVGVTGLARAGKTVLLTTIASILLTPGALDARIRGTRIAPSGAGNIPRFDHASHRASLAADPPRWPSRTDAVSMLAIELTVGAPPLPARTLRVELLDYPGEWLLDLPLLDLGYAEWSRATFRRLADPALAPEAGAFVAFARGLATRAPRDETLALTGHRLYCAALQQLRDARGLSMLQPGRFLMPAPGEPPPWIAFFPLESDGPLAALLRRRYDAYVEDTRRALLSPLFGRVDRVVVLADLLGALHAGPHAFADARAALEAAGATLQRQGSWTAAIRSLAALRLPPPSIRRVAFAASKADHVSERQRGNLAALMGALTTSATPDRRAVWSPEGNGPRAASFAIAAARCTEDFVWTLDGHPVSAVRGRLLGDDRLTRSYPGEVPDRPPGPEFWTHQFLAPPPFEPARIGPEPSGRTARPIPNIGVADLLRFLLDDLL